MPPLFRSEKVLTGISSININVKDLKKAIDFYTNQLGMKLIVNEPKIDHYEVAAQGSNGPGICLCEDSKLAGEPNGIIFSTKDIQETYRKFKKNGVRVTEPYQAHGQWWAGFKDLDSNAYGLHQV
jgi:predicted enzyme related to lactoylglutathione lyase